jgi:exosortase A
MSRRIPPASPDSLRLAAGAAEGSFVAWRMPLLAFLLGLLALGLIFREEAEAAVRTWDSSATYNHGWLILPISIWLAWSRRHRLAALRPEPVPWAALLALPGVLAWLAAERLGVMEGRQFAVIGFVWVLALAVLGWRACRAMAAPLVYLVFLVPFGAFITPALQTITARMIDLLLDATNIPHYVDDLIIETPAGTFLVAEACAGLRFLIAAIAFGVLYAFVMFRSPGRRLIVMALAVVVPIGANGFRAFGIVLLGHYLGSAEAAAADHVVYGWVFFSVVILLLILAGLPFREDGAPEPAPEVAAPVGPAPRGVADPAPRNVVLAGAVVLAAGIAAAGPAVSLSLDRAGNEPPERMALALAAPEGCATQPGGMGLRCAGGLLVQAEAIVFPAQATWRVVAAERWRRTGSNDQDMLFTVQVPGGGTWRARQQHEAGTTVALATWLNGRVAGGGLRSRAEQAWNTLGGGAGNPVLVVVSLRAEDEAAGTARQRALLEALLQAQGAGIAARAGAMSSGR